MTQFTPLLKWLSVTLRVNDKQRQSHLSTSRPAWSASLLFLCLHFLLLLSLLTSLHEHRTLLFLRLPRPYLRAFALTIPSAWVIPLSVIFMACFLNSFRSSLKHHLLSESFPDHPLENATTSPHYLLLLSTDYSLTHCIFYSLVLLTFCLLFPNISYSTWGRIVDT